MCLALVFIHFSQGQNVITNKKKSKCNIYILVYIKFFLFMVMFLIQNKEASVIRV